jgi:hypothetical protein
MSLQLPNLFIVGALKMTSINLDFSTINRDIMLCA